MKRRECLVLVTGFMKGRFTRGKNYMHNDYVDNTGRRHLIMQRTQETYKGFVLSFHEVRSNGSKAVRGLAVKGGVQHFAWGRTKDQTLAFLKRMIDR